MAGVALVSVVSVLVGALIVGIPVYLSVKLLELFASFATIEKDKRD